MSIKTVKLDSFDFYRLLSLNPELDRLLKSNPEGLDLQVKRLGTYQIRQHPPLSGNYCRYQHYWISQTDKKPETTKTQEDK